MDLDVLGVSEIVNHGDIFGRGKGRELEPRLSTTGIILLGFKRIFLFWVFCEISNTLDVNHVDFGCLSLRYLGSRMKVDTLMI